LRPTRHAYPLPDAVWSGSRPVVHAAANAAAHAAAQPPGGGTLVMANDTETTAKNAKTARVVQFAARFCVVQERETGERYLEEVCDEDGCPVTYSPFVHPGMAIPADATKVHGITDAMVVGAPRLVAVADALIVKLEEVANPRRFVLFFKARLSIVDLVVSKGCKPAFQRKRW